MRLVEAEQSDLLLGRLLDHDLLVDLDYLDY